MKRRGPGAFVPPRFINQQANKGSGSNDACNTSEVIRGQDFPALKRQVTAHATMTAAQGQAEPNGKENHQTRQYASSFKSPFPGQPTRQTLVPPRPLGLTLPAISCGNAPPASLTATTQEPGDIRYLSVLFIKYESYVKKMASKSYLDGIMLLTGSQAELRSLDSGKVMSVGKVKRVTKKELLKDRPKAKPKKGKSEESDDDEEEEEQELFRLGGFVVEVQSEVCEEDYKSGKCFQAQTSYGLGSAAAPGMRKTAVAFKPVAAGAGAGSTARPGASSGHGRPAASQYDPNQPGTMLLNEEMWKGGTGRLDSGRPVAPVFVDPYIGRHLRPHQREGVQFLYDCVSGSKNPGFQGCILADEMGLGKTLQVLTLIWTLLKHGVGEGQPFSKCCVVTPATLTENWAKEVKRWLGVERLQVFMCTSDAKDAVHQFKHGTVTKLCIVSYEVVRKYSSTLQGCFDLLVCDEGHRLKSLGGNKTINALLELNCPRRILLTGTPVQNNLQEFFSLIEFVAPGMLGAVGAFRRVFADPIARAQERDAKPEEKALGASRAKELNARIGSIVLRRTQAILAKHLPPLTNLVLFAAPSPVQRAVYQEVLKLARRSDDSLGAITALKKVCNHPMLVSRTQGDQEEDGAAGGGGAPASATAAWAPPSLDLGAGQCEASGKMAVLAELLDAVMASGNERMVIVATSVMALDAIDAMVIAPRRLHSVRIDGRTSPEDRQSVVDNFNTRLGGTGGGGDVFLLSTRAGGAGLNLVGANHLVLYDSDWNPAADLQAMSRIWRDGQQLPCSVWRLLTSGTIEEKIFQRQLMKGDLAGGCGMASNGAASGRHFTREELRELFTFTESGCETQGLLAGSSSSASKGLTWLSHGQAAPSGLLWTTASAALEAAYSTGLVTAVSAVLKKASDDDEGSGPEDSKGGQEEQEEEQEEDFT